MTKIIQYGVMIDSQRPFFFPQITVLQAATVLVALTSRKKIGD